MWYSSLEHRPINQKVTGSIPGQGTCLGCGFSPQSGCIQEATDCYFCLTLMFLSLSLFSPLSKKQKIKINNRGDEDVEKLESLYIAGGNIKWFSTMEHSLMYGKLNQTLTFHVTQEFLSWNISQRTENKYPNKRTFTHLQQHYSPQPKDGHNENIH